MTNADQVVVFVSPHQDDETLAMGSAIRNHIEQGYDVHVLLATNGINSGARPIVGLTRTKFTDARDNELRRATATLGVPPENLHISRHSTEDGNLTIQAATDSIAWFLDRHPAAWVKAYSPHSATGRHADHVMSGVAAANLHAAGQITNLRHYVEPWLVDTFRAAHPAVRLGPERATSLATVQAAYDSYGDGYGIGHISVPTFFAAGRPDPVNYWHVP
ncbi:PIG-L deacetylase family protein [Pseudonocardia parietis]|uniref:LmbE family N-acetylglucosaminyl deacetylase n=1 Tax=Pseudonocardia parietis TaxID=570936 RepID=A0ABS4W2G6_9PSEU|nr:PIG-L family deacetylase [Pseudonocardia parietis]MBP2370211.1 LmbE family N-acetylglucosaminyl deacetylase [Pseudonocardia parietis]